MHLDIYKKNRILSKILLATKAMQKWTNLRENKKRSEEVRLEVDAWIAAQRLNRLAQVLPRCLRSFPAQFLDDFTKLLLIALDRDDGDFK